MNVGDLSVFLYLLCFDSFQYFIVFLELSVVTHPFKHSTTEAEVGEFLWEQCQLSLYDKLQDSQDYKESVSEKKKK